LTESLFTIGCVSTNLIASSLYVLIVGVFGSAGSNHIVSGSFGMNGCETGVGQCNGGIHVNEDGMICDLYV